MLQPETLRAVAESAAHEFLTNKIPLNTTIFKEASELSGLTQEHVKRIVEKANEAVFLAKHGQDKLAGSKVSSPSWPLADSAVVIKKLGKLASPVVAGASDYDSMPEIPSKRAEEAADWLHNALKLSSAPEPLDLREMRKQASSMLEDIRRNQQTIDGMIDEHQAGLLAEQSAFFKEACRHLEEGHPIDEILVAAGSACQDEAKTAALLEPFIRRLVGEGYVALPKLASAAGNLDSYRGRVVDPTHPLVSHFRAVVEHTEALAKTTGARIALDQEEQKVASHIQKNFPLIRRKG
jgi:hypothetical protein